MFGKLESVWAEVFLTQPDDALVEADWVAMQVEFRPVDERLPREVDRELSGGAEANGLDVDLPRPTLASLDMTHGPTGLSWVM